MRPDPSAEDSAQMRVLDRAAHRGQVSVTAFGLVSWVSGAEGDRTPNLSIANAALSQLSYGPEPLNSTQSPVGVNSIAHSIASVPLLLGAGAPAKLVERQSRKIYA